MASATATATAPFALRPSPFALGLAKGFDKLSPNGN